MKNNLFKTEVKKLSDAVVISFYEKGTKRLMGTISATVNHCLICGKSYVEQEKKDICDGCKMILDRYKVEGNRLYTKDGGRPEPIVRESQSEELKAEEIKEENTEPKVRKVKTVVNYNKGNDPVLNFIRIENLDELYEKIDTTKMSIGKFETLLKYAIQGLSYQTIAQKLNIKEMSVRTDYNFLSKYNLVINGTYQPSVTTKIIHGNITEAPSNLVGLDKTAYIKLKDLLTKWTNMETLMRQTKMQRRTLLTYIWRLNNLDLIEKRGTVNKEYRLATV